MRSRNPPARVCYIYLSMRLEATLVLLILAAQTAAAQSAKDQTVWDGVYTAAQAEHGKTVYADHCSQCHKDDLSAYEGVLRGNRFMDHWREDSLDNFFLTMKSTMPRGAPASLPNAAYLDLVAYVLQANDFPAGSKELRADALRAIKVQGKSGPQDVPAGALIDVVGCLLQDSANSWALANATEPLRTRNPNDSTADELKHWEATPLGTHKFGLMDAGSYHPDAQKGHKVEAKGFLIRNPGEDRINVTAMQMTGTKCSQ